MKNVYLLLIVIVALLIPVSGCYGGGPWKGKVVDAETKQPIEGAAVVAVWEKTVRLSPGGAMDMFLHAEETVTDKNGEFKIPSKYFLSIPFLREVDGPYFTIYKPGYGPFPRYQIFSPPLHTPGNFFEGNGATAELPKAKNLYERINFMGDAGLPPDYPDKIAPILKKLIKNERKAVGFES